MQKPGWIWIGITLLAVLLASGSALAENRVGAFTLTPEAGWHIFEGDQNVDDDWTLGLGFGYNYTENWATEVMLNYTDASGDNGGPDLDTWTLTLNGLYHFLPEGPFTPYLQAGVGANHNNFDPGPSAQNNLLLDYGLGAKYFVTPDVALRLDGRHVIAFPQGLDEWSETDNNLLLTAGVTFQFGGPQPAPAPAPAPAPVAAAGPQDSDGDGVMNAQDECPDTPQGVTVDEKGCPVDSDNDGVPDFKDQCPDTRPGVMVDDQGCDLSMNIHIEFDFDKAEIKPKYHDELAKAANFIMTHESPKILIGGHTDSIGTESYNKDLSDRRAAAVRQYLIDNFDINPDRLVARGYGESRPIASNDTPAGRQQNRRTEIVCCVFIPEE